MFDIRKNNKFLTDSFIAHAIPIYISLLSNIRLKTTSEASLKNELKEYFWKEFLKDPKVTDMKDDIESIRFLFLIFLMYIQDSENILCSHFSKFFTNVMSIF